MEFATGAMSSLLPKLGELLKEEYNLPKGVKKDVQSLEVELASMHSALRKVGEVPHDQLDEQVKLWARDVRELSYDMEDIVDTHLVRVEGADPAANQARNKGLIKKLVKMLKKRKTRHQIADEIKDIKSRVQDVADRHNKYKVDDVVANLASVTPIDPRLRALYAEVTELVGIHEKRDQELIKKLSEGDDMSKKKLKTVSVVGFGGLGKTTLVRAVKDKIKGDFHCSAFVPVGRNPVVKKVLKDILIELNKEKYMKEVDLTVLDERQLIDEVREFLENKRYLIIIDDVWDEKMWELIRCAFSNGNNLGSRLITTTRKVSVSEACCSSSDDFVYKMEPLSGEDSQRLFYQRIFSHTNGCPPELEQVSREILKKCGGIPLAIVTIASLLASNKQIKTTDQWYTLLNSIGRGLAEHYSVEEMQKILSFSYYDLPSHLKTCLLYLSIFPEDYMMQKDELIWRWIAEGFVQCEKPQASLFELGKSYFNELINRSLIQPVEDNDYIFIDSPTSGRVLVHDMVLDLICSLSSDENFVTVLDGIERSITNSQSKVRRLSLQNTPSKVVDQSIAPDSVSQVRSVTVFAPATNLIPPLLSFHVLRVLDLSGCDLEKSSHLNLKDVGDLFHLRYLGLRNTGIRELPAEIGNLQFLLLLDVRYNYNLKELPPTVVKLRRLMCLLFSSNYLKRFPDGMGNLTSMEALSEWSFSTRMSPNIVKELRNLTRLRYLKIELHCDSLELEEAFVESVCNLPSIQSVLLRGHFESLDLLGERWVPPRHLRGFDSADIGTFSTLPAWVKGTPSLLSNLSLLAIEVEEFGQEDLQILGRLPALLSLHIGRFHQTQRLLLVDADGFRCTRRFSLYGELTGLIMIQPGALPVAEIVCFDLGVRVAKDEGNGDFDFGLGNLLSLRKFEVFIYHDGATVGEAEQAEAALSHAIDVHPNHPTIHLEFFPDIEEDAPT